jgi:adenine-specific DNA-methyltransferase
MISGTEALYRYFLRFTNGSAEGLLQLLLAAAHRSTLKRIIACPTYPVAVKTGGLSDAVRQFQEASHQQEVHLPTLLARLYTSVRPLDARKRSGQFFTSQAVAESALTLARPSLNDDVCDAGSGTAVFADAILNTGVSIHSYVGVENDPILALCAAHVLESINAPHSFRIWYANFLLLNDAAFNAQGLRAPTFVIANPPFVRSHHLSGRNRIRVALKSSLGVTLSPFSGSLGYFIARAAELAGSAINSLRNPKSNAPALRRPNGRLLFLLPREASGAAYIQQLRDDLRSEHGWTCREHEISTTQTGVDGHQSNALALFFVFEQKKKQRRLPPLQSKELSRMRDLLLIRRGISTGRNDFFVLTEEEVQHRKIDKEKWLKRVLPTRIHVPDTTFLEKDWQRLCETGYPCWLLALPNHKLEDLDAPVRKYLREGLRRGLHATPTAQAMRTWFSLPIPKNPPDVFVTYFFRGAPRFILNEARVFHLTNILGGRFVSPNLDFNQKETIVSLLNKQAEHWMAGKIAGREYKRGLRKIEPRELSMLIVDSAILELANPEKRAAKATSASLFD